MHAPDVSLRFHCMFASGTGRPSKHSPLTASITLCVYPLALLRLVGELATHICSVVPMWAAYRSSKRVKQSKSLGIYMLWSELA